MDGGATHTCSDHLNRLISSHFHAFAPPKPDKRLLSESLTDDLKPSPAVASQLAFPGPNPFSISFLAPFTASRVVPPRHAAAQHPGHRGGAARARYKRSLRWSSPPPEHLLDAFLVSHLISSHFLFHLLLSRGGGGALFEHPRASKMTC